MTEVFVTDRAWPVHTAIGGLAREIAQAKIGAEPESTEGMAMTENEQHEGGCVCGAVRYRTTGTPKRVSACSCTWCQRRTGSALGISVYFDKQQIEFTQGELKSYRLVSDAGRWIESQFCPTCGSTVTWTLEFLPDFRGIAGGSFDQPTFWYNLQRFVFARSKPPWLAIPEGIEIHQAMPGCSPQSGELNRPGFTPRPRPGGARPDRPPAWRCRVAR